ncbi:MAG: hypothetical protein K8S18_21910 [Desulfobacula sp.]|nr:hypothetical protein [Desulfobacula sp.]
MERRKTTDFWANLLFYLNILAWILLIVILLVFHRAQPEFETLFDRFYHLKLRTDWDIQYLYYLIYMVIFGIFISLSGLLLGIFRGRRENDHKKALIITGIISLIMLGVSMIVL